MEAIILAGGKGTRLSPVVNDIPKPLAPISDKPFLDYLLEWLALQKIDKVILSIGYKGALIQNRYKSKFGTVVIEYCNEDTPLGTGGAIKKALQFCNAENVFVMNGDTFFDVDPAAMHNHHIKTSADITIAVKDMENFDRYGTVITCNGVVTSFQEKKFTKKGLINGGVYIIRRGIFYGFDMPDVFSFENDFLCKPELKIFAIPFDGKFVDIGVPQDYELAQTIIPQLELI